jgi:hypothetical protein
MQEDLCSHMYDHYRTLNNHVVHDHTTVHHLPYLRFRLNKSWVPDNDKTCLKHTKCPLKTVGDVDLARGLLLPIDS